MLHIVVIRRQNWSWL